ncbi:D-tyrosyl-tRNA(Tyr) deacylase [Candidatus Peregrinibacteria bacterium]|nr:D-tyrosyl-tRNA(Tyr) deacylase [Candidatus Peregrinibacteria bacterium]
MKVLIQKVSQAKVMVLSEILGAINQGFLLFLGVKATDTAAEIPYLVDKIVNLRIFPDQNGKFQYSLLDVKGEVLIVSQFTLYCDVSKGRRPSFTDAADLDNAKRLYDEFVDAFRATGLHVATGQFQAMMEVHLINDGPVTILIEK